MCSKILCINVKKIKKITFLFTKNIVILCYKILFSKVTL